MKNLQIIAIFVVIFAFNGCFAQKVKSLLKKDCDSILKSFSTFVINDKGRLSSNIDISDFLIEHKECLVGKSRGEIIGTLGIPIGGMEIQEASMPYSHNTSYTTSQKCKPIKKVCRQILFRINHETKIVEDVMIILSQ